MGRLGEVAKPFKLRIEGPVDMEEREKRLKEKLDKIKDKYDYIIID